MFCLIVRYEYMESLYVLLSLDKLIQRRRKNPVLAEYPTSSDRAFKLYEYCAPSFLRIRTLLPSRSFFSNSYRISIVLSYATFLCALVITCELRILVLYYTNDYIGCGDKSVQLFLTTSLRPPKISLHEQPLIS